MKDEILINKISFPSTIKNRNPHLFEPNMIELPIKSKILAYDFLDQFNKEYVIGDVENNNIIFISDLNDITFFHYMDQPKSMLSRKLMRNLITEDFVSFDYNWLPNCFRHIIL